MTHSALHNALIVGLARMNEFLKSGARVRCTVPLLNRNIRAVSILTFNRTVPYIFDIFGSEWYGNRRVLRTAC